MSKTKNNQQTVLDLVIIGGGQAGLSSAYYAEERGLNYVVLEKAKDAGHAWRTRYDSLTLFTPRRYSQLPGMQLVGDPEGYPTKDEVADYLESYANKFNLKVALGRGVNSLAKSGEVFSIETSQEKYCSRNVIVATGPFQTPRIPKWSKQLPIPHRHSSSYHNPGEMPKGKLLVVGGGNSGAQIAEELAAKHGVTLASRGRLVFVPTRLMGRSLFWWIDTFGILNAPTDSRRGRWLRKQIEPIIGTNLKRLIRLGKVRVKPEASDGEGSTITFADGSGEECAGVIWATGFTTNYSWLKIPSAVDSSGRAMHSNAKSTEIDGLYFMGLNWLRSRNSGLIGGVGADAKYIFENYFS